MGRPARAASRSLGDVSSPPALVSLTGGRDSPFTFTYSLAVVAGVDPAVAARRACRRRRRARWRSRAHRRCASSWGSCARRPAAAIGGAAAASPLASNVLAQFLIAALAGYLGRQLAATGGRLSAARGGPPAAGRAAASRSSTACPPGWSPATAEGEVTFVNRGGASDPRARGSGDAPARTWRSCSPASCAAPAGRPRAELTVDDPARQRILGLAVTPLEEHGRRALLVVFQDLTELRRMRRSCGGRTGWPRWDALGAAGARDSQPAGRRCAARRSCSRRTTRGPPARVAAGAHPHARVGPALARWWTDFLRFARPPPPVRRTCGWTAGGGDGGDAPGGSADPRGGRSTRPAPVAGLADPDQLRRCCSTCCGTRWRRPGRAAGCGFSVGESGHGADPRLGLGGQHRRRGPGAHLRAVLHQAPGRAPAWACPRRTRSSGPTAGMIAVSSSPRRGTEFMVGLPPPRRRSAGVQDPGRRRRAVDAASTSRCCSRGAGYEVRTAARLRRRQEALGTRPVDLVDLRHEAGRRSSGLERAEGRPRACRRRPEVILITAFGTPASRGGGDARRAPTTTSASPSTTRS